MRNTLEELASSHMDTTTSSGVGRTVCGKERRETGEREIGRGGKMCEKGVEGKRGQMRRRVNRKRDEN